MFLLPKWSISLDIRWFKKNMIMALFLGQRIQLFMECKFVKFHNSKIIRIYANIRKDII